MTSSRAIKLLLLVNGLLVAVSALNPVPHRTNEESLRGALNAVTRKQRSLNANPQEYYEYKGSSNRQQVANEQQDDDNLAFIPAGKFFFLLNVMFV